MQSLCVEAEIFGCLASTSCFMFFYVWLLCFTEQQQHTHTTISGQWAHSNGEMSKFAHNIATVPVQMISEDFDSLPEPDFALATVMFNIPQLRTVKLS